MPRLPTLRDATPLLALAFLLLLPAAASQPGAGAAEAPWWERTGLDGDGDGVDDALQPPPAGGDARVIVSYRAPPTAQERAALEARGATVLRAYDVIPALLVEAPAHALPRLAQAPGVALVEADRALRPLLDESRGLVRAPAAWRLGPTGEGVTVAVLDTGVDTRHPDLAGRVVASYDATAPDTLLGRLLGGRQPTATDVTDGHGTHVAGVVASTGAQSDGRYRGVAPGAGIANVKVFDAAGNGSTSYVLSGIDWVVANKDRLDIRVMQMSLGGKPTDGTDALSRAVDAAADRGLLTVASAGNSGPDAGTVGVPGVAARALTVGAVDKAGEVARFSARGPTVDGRRKPDVVAPGVAITSALPPTAAGGAHYGAQSGTSMAAPHVAGAAALVFQANGSLTPALAKWVLTATSTPTGPTPSQWHAAYGWGHVDAAAAVRAAENPAILGEPPFEATASRVPVDGAESPLEQLRYSAEKAQRGVPAAPWAAAAAVLAAGALLRAGQRKG